MKASLGKAYGQVNVGDMLKINSCGTIRTVLVVASKREARLICVLPAIDGPWFDYTGRQGPAIDPYAPFTTVEKIEQAYGCTVLRNYGPLEVQE